jgi:hypothetical protein
MNLMDLPEEILIYTFSFLPHVSLLGTLSCVCKRTRSIIRNNLNLWKSFCEIWWESRPNFNSGWTLEDIINASSQINKQGWKWFAQCTAFSRTDGLSYSISQDGTKLCIGMMKNGKLHGQGIQLTLEDDDGSTFIGQFREGVMEGVGMFQLWDGTRFRGALHHGYPHGRGSKQWPNGDVYEGSFDRGMVSGKGNYVWSNGIKYEGYWNNFRFHGEGLVIWTNGFKFKGKFTYHKPDGEKFLLNLLLISLRSHQFYSSQIKSLH